MQEAQSQRHGTRVTFESQFTIGMAFLVRPAKIPGISKPIEINRPFGFNDL